MKAWPQGSLAPAAVPAPRLLLLGRQTRAELLLTLRKPQALVLNLVIPVTMLVVLSTSRLGGDGIRNVDRHTPAVLALALVSSAFTGQAISLGFERSYGVLKRLGATPLTRGLLVGAKTLATLAVQVVQVATLAVVALGLGWQPHGSPLIVLSFLVAGNAAFCGCGLLLGGTATGQTSLALANVLWVALVILGGLVVPLPEYGAARSVVELLPTAALTEGFRAAFTTGHLALRELATLAAWAALTLGVAARAFRWA